MTTTDVFNWAASGSNWVIVDDPVPERGYDDDEDQWANLFERDDQSDVYEMFDGLRNDCD